MGRQAILATAVVPVGGDDSPVKLKKMVPNQKKIIKVHKFSVKLMASKEKGEN